MTWRLRTLHYAIDLVIPNDWKRGEMFVFGYGSLFDPASASQTLGRAISDDDLVDAVLLDYRRDWGIYIPVVFDETDEVDAQFLDIQTAQGHYTNGALLHVSDRELAILVGREAQYDLIDITDRTISAAAGSGQVMTFRGQEAFRAPSATRETVVPLRYRQRIDNAIARRGERFAQSFNASTLAATAPDREGPYRFADPAQANALNGRL